MNRIYRSIWNEVSRTFVAVAEKVHAKGKPATGPSGQATVGELATGRATARPHALSSRVRVKPRALEQRFMFDAAAVSTVIDTVTDHPTSDAQAETGLSAALDKVVQAVALEQEANRVLEPVLVREGDVAADGGRKEVAFVDSRVADYQTLVDGIGADIEVGLIDGSQDGLAQLAAWAASHSGYDAIHILSHGNDGQLSLGAGTIDLAVLQARGDQLAALGQALTVDGDILLYGCDVASSQSGAEFISTLARATQADVAASSNATGSTALGGDWVLEQTVGQVAMKGLVFENYDALLATPVEGNTTFDSISSPYTEYAHSTTAGSTGISATNIAGSGWDVKGYASGDGTNFVIASEIWGSTKLIYIAHEGGGRRLPRSPSPPTTARCLI